ncbi:MAG: hypothetical protein FWF77_01725 [Defluviitaleaceae bacterium]|nr:hypothetical protein [Defluviitaleaceae bacterium]
MLAAAHSLEAGSNFLAHKKTSRRVTLADSFFSANRKLLPVLRECVAKISPQKFLPTKNLQIFT